MQYARSGTALDQVGGFMPQRLLGIGRFAGRGMGYIGDEDSFVVSDSSTYDPATYWEASDPVASYPMDSTYYPGTPPFSDDYGMGYPTNPPSSNAPFNWSQLPALAKDLFIAYKQGEIQSKLLDVNVQRARQGLPPLDASRYAPGVNVGLTPKTQQFLGVGIGTLALGGAALFMLTRRKSRR